VFLPSHASSRPVLAPNAQLAEIEPLLSFATDCPWVRKWRSPPGPEQRRDYLQLVTCRCIYYQGSLSPSAGEKERLDIEAIPATSCLS
jgi:hypothetical protein